MGKTHGVPALRPDGSEKLLLRNLALELYA